METEARHERCDCPPRESVEGEVLDGHLHEWTKKMLVQGYERADIVQALRYAAGRVERGE